MYLRWGADVLITSPGSLLLLLDTFLTTAGYDV